MIIFDQLGLIRVVFEVGQSLFHYLTEVSQHILGSIWQIMSEEKKKVIHSVSINFIWNGLLKLFGVIFPLITFPYATRCLGVESLGRVSFVSSIISYFSLCANLGIPTYGIRACSSVRDNKEELSRTVHEILFINIITTCISYMILFGSVLFIPQFAHERDLMMVTSATLIFSCIGMEWLYSAIEEYRYITIRSFVFKILSIVCLYCLVKNPDDYLIYAGISVMASVGSNVFNLMRIRKIIYTHSVGNYNYRRHIKPIFTFFAASVAILIYTHIDTSMLGFMSTNVEVGYYTVAVKIKTVLLNVITSVGVVLLPRITYYISNHQEEQANILIRKSFHLIFAISLPLVVFFELNAYNSIVIIGGEEYLNAQQSMMVLMPLLLIVGCSNVLVYQFVLPRGKEKQYCYITIISALVDIAINALLIPRVGALGAAFGTVVAEMVGLVLMLLLLCRYLVPVFNKILLGPILMSTVVAVLVERFVFSMCIQKNTPLGDMFFSAICFWSVYIAGIFILKDPLIIEGWKKVALKVKKKI